MTKTLDMLGWIYETDTEELKETILNYMGQQYGSMITAYSNGSRYYHYKKLVECYNKFQFVAEIWDFDPDAFRVIDRFQLKGQEPPKAKKMQFNDTAPMARQMPGLYLIGQTNYCPVDGHTNYYIKIGMAKNLDNRLKQYKTYNPFFWIADCLYVNSNVNLLSLEHIFHNNLAIFGEQLNNSEWYEVSAEDYTTICEKGFPFFSTAYRVVKDNNMEAAL